jgi:hypothetical protein
MKPLATILAAKIKAMKAGAVEHQEAMAAEVFDLERVVEIMGKATAQGFRTVKIGPALPIDLSGTKAAREIAAMLEKAGATVDWIARPPIDASTGERGCDLVVRW